MKKFIFLITIFSIINWNLTENKLIEFIFPLENIEIIQNVNDNKNNLFN